MEVVLLEHQKRCVDRHIRMKPAELSRIQMLARIYADGNFSRWVIHGALNAPRVYLSDKKKRDEKK